MSELITTDTQQMALRMKIHKEVALQLDALYTEAEKFGKTASQSFGKERGKAQLRNLQNIANSTLKVSDVLDYIKRQTARMREWKNDHFGADLLRFMTNEITHRRDAIVSLLSDEFSILDEHQGAFRQQEISLHLIRGFVKQIVIQFEWALEEKYHGHQA